MNSKNVWVLERSCQEMYESGAPIVDIREMLLETLFILDVKNQALVMSSDLCKENRHVMGVICHRAESAMLRNLLKKYL